MRIINRDALLQVAGSPPALNRRRRALDMVDRALEAVAPGPCTSRALDRLEAEGFDFTGATVIAFGKAARGMAEVVLSRVDVARGILLYPGSDPLEPLEVFEATHPLPSPAAATHGAAVLALADSLVEGDTALCLISGGGSAMLEAPAVGVTIEQIRELTRFLLLDGADIRALNRAREPLSAVKGGKLAARLRPARVVNIVLSDVPGDELRVVASGPTIADHATSLVAADNATARGATGLRDWGELIVGPAHLAGARFHQAAWMRADDVVAGGETTVEVRGDGVGGRNQEFVLGAITAFRGGLTLSVGTDGIDGASPAAGGFVDALVMRKMAALGLDPAQALSSNDSYTFLKAAGGVIETGATGTNVADLMVHLV